MRRKDRELSTDQAMALLGEVTEGVLCLAADDQGYPCAVPMNAALIDGALVFHCAPEGEKLRALARDNRARFVAVLGSELCAEKLTTYYRSVIVKGRVSIPEGEAALQLVCEMTARLVGGAAAEYAPKAEGAAQRMKVLVMEIDEVTGKANEEKEGPT